jgi:hypothetical protein
VKPRSRNFAGSREVSHHQVLNRIDVVEGRMAALEQDKAQLEDENARLLAMQWSLNERVVTLESRIGVEAPPEHDDDWMTIKMAAHKAACSESQIRKLIKNGKLAHKRIGLRVFVIGSALAKLLSPCESTS